MAATSEEQERQLKLEGELRQLTLAHEEMSRLVNEKANALLQSNTLLQSEIAERKKMEADLLEITQAEQKRFGSQLHDGLCQELTAILVFTKALTQKMEKEKTLELEGLNRLSTMLLKAVDQARDTARGLYPGELEGASLMHSLEELASQTAGVSCVFRCPQPILINDNNIATHLYKIAQEGVSNAVKHGKARNIEVSFTRDGPTVCLAIQDDGFGMPDELKNAKGIGLKIMKYRSQMINAAFQIKKSPSGGVRLECSLTL